jgi:hypothetical protein
MSHVIPTGEECFNNTITLERGSREGALEAHWRDHSLMRDKWNRRGTTMTECNRSLLTDLLSIMERVSRVEKKKKNESR